MTRRARPGFGAIYALGRPVGGPLSRFSVFLLLLLLPGWSIQKLWRVGSRASEEGSCEFFELAAQREQGRGRSYVVVVVMRPCSPP